VTSQKKLKIADEYPTSLKLITIQRRPPGDQRPGPPLPNATGHCFLEQHHTGSGKTAQDAKPAYTGEMRKAMHQCALGSRSSSPSSVGVAGGGGGGGGCCGAHCFLDNSTTATQHVVVVARRGGARLGKRAGHLHRRVRASWWWPRFDALRTSVQAAHHSVRTRCHGLTPEHCHSIRWADFSAHTVFSSAWPVTDQAQQSIGLARCHAREDSLGSNLVTQALAEGGTYV
jgi:hypothetical protein